MVRHRHAVVRRKAQMAIIRPKHTRALKDPRHHGPVVRELKAIALAEAKGYEVLRYGWPDMLLYRASDKTAVFLEVKSPADKVNTYQRRMHQVLKELGLNVQVFTVK